MRAWRSPRATTGSPGSARCCGATRSTSCPNLWNVVRGEMSIVGPRPTLESQVLAYTPHQRGRLAVKPRHHRLGPGQRPRVAAVAGADRARPLVRRAPFAGARPDDPAPNGRHGRARPRDLQGSDGRMAGPDQRDVAVLLTGVGKRYDIVSAFAQHATVIAADPNPLAPAQYAAHHRRPVPRIDDPGYVPALRGAVLGVRRRSGRAADRPRPRGARRTHGSPAGCRRSSPTPSSRARRSTSTRRTCCWSGSGCPRRRPCSRASRSTATR